jgi:hypothetical protein
VAEETGEEADPADRDMVAEVEGGSGKRDGENKISFV